MSYMDIIAAFVGIKYINLWLFGIVMFGYAWLKDIKEADSLDIDRQN